MSTVIGWKAKYKKWLARVVCSILAVVVILLVLDMIFPFRLTIAYSTIVKDCNGKIMHAYLSSDDKWRLKTELSEVNPLLRKTFLQKEDKWFYYHTGFNPIAAGRALFNNLFYAKRTSGASTITMQVARMSNPKKRTYSNKVVEIWNAIQLEMHYSKDEIFQAYINLIPYGGNIEGIKSAAMIYFQKPPQQLSLAEIVVLTIIPNKPTSLVKPDNYQQLMEQRNKWLLRFHSEKVFDRTIIVDAIGEPLQLKRHSLPKYVPHFCNRIKGMSNEPIIATTLDYKMQEIAQGITSTYAQRMRGINVNNAAVLILDNTNGNVLAYIGSPDYADAANAGQVDGVRAVRSPGSTLKPLLYACAFDKGLLTPQMQIEDVPINVAGYVPENFDQKHNGSVTTEFALINSLNIPAVKTLNDVSINHFVSRLKQAGFESVARNEKQLGLSVILGGCGATLEELSRLYSSFANNGQLRPLNYLQQHCDTSKVQLVSKESAFMLTSILTQLNRPDMPNNFSNTKRSQPVAWKTGTSYGRRDAWCIGYNHRYTIGVWLGNFSGQGVPELTGADMSTPLLISLFNAVEDANKESWMQDKGALALRSVCSTTGKVPGDDCSDKTVDWYIPMVSNYERCMHNRDVAVSPDMKYSYCSGCKPADGNYNTIRCPNISLALTSFYQQQGIAFAKLPAHNPLCTHISTDASPQIISPSAKADYVLAASDSSQLLLQSQAASDVARVYWYIDDMLYKAAAPDERVFFKPHTGNIKITCIDDKGRSSDVTISARNL
ncbi:MAG: penicillin-binding protein 1C [Bacteroidetes bacterium]|nr:penicillin-binding protein 1C [Bacteroidota bacterium]